MKLSLRIKTITGIASIAALLLLVLIVTVFQLLNDLVDSNIKKSADTTVALFVSTTKNAFLSYDLAALDADVSEILTNPNIAYVKVKDKLGRVFVDLLIEIIDAEQRRDKVDKRMKCDICDSAWRS